MIAAVLLALVLAAFLFQWRTVLIALVTIPVSLVAAALVLDLMGETFNAISFAGLAVALAIVIDDAVVGAENVARRLRQQREAGSDKSISSDRGRGLARGAEPARRTRPLIVLLAIVPVAIMEGRPGAFFEPLALAYALAVVAAMVVALTLTPALSVLLFSRGTPGGRESPLLRRLTPRYDGALSRFVRTPRNGADRRGCMCGGRARRDSAAGHLADPVVQGPRRAGPPRRRARDVEPAHDADHDAGQPRSCAASRVSTTSVPTSDARSARTRSATSTRARSGSASTPAPTTTRRSRRSRTRSDRVAGRPPRRRHLLDPEDQGRRGAATRARTRSRATASTC